jgi:2,3-bisphosphoglycerate-independent phosphoglycerate mutase
MKYIVLVPDGAAGYADEIDGRSVLEAAHIPNMDRMAREGIGGLVQMIPDQRHPGSDIGNLEIFGYDSRIHYTGRAPLEAASMGIDLGAEGVAFRCNLIHRDDDILVDYSAGHISTDEGKQVVEGLAAELENEAIRFYPGVGYRHIMVYRNGPEGLVSYPPHDIMGQSIKAHLPSGDGQEKIRAIMTAAEPLLADSPVNQQRADNGDATANAIWLWGAGRALSLESLKQRHGLKGGVISAVDLVLGIGRCAGWQPIEVPGITGYLDTNYSGKAEYALRALEDMDIVYVHVESPDEAGHNGDAALKQQAVEDFDRWVAGPLLTGLQRFGEYRLLMTPDHRTPVALRTHSREPVPFVLWGSGWTPDGLTAYSETAAAAGSLQVGHGHELMEYLLGSKTV